MKRILDVVGSLVGLVISSPLWPFAAVWIRLDSPGPVFHRATRVGMDGKLFTLYKFRTMRVASEVDGLGITSAGDTRVTRSGRVLRRSKIDELPQLYNVLIGDMSLVGPRPEDPRYVRFYSEDQRRVLTVRPGITSPASIAYRHEEQLLRGAAQSIEQHYVNTVMPAKLALDLRYVDERSVRTDLVILLRTFRALFAST